MTERTTTTKTDTTSNGNNTTNDNTNPPPVKYKLDDFIMSSNGQEYVSDKCYDLSHNGDFIELYVPEGFKYIEVEVATKRTETHYEMGPFHAVKIATRGPVETNYNDKIKVETGKTYTILNKEYYDVVRPGTINEYDRIDNCDKRVTLLKVVLDDDTYGEISDKTKPNVPVLYWHLFNTESGKNEEVDHGQGRTENDCEDAARSAATLRGLKTYRVDIYDGAGNLRRTNNFPNEPLAPPAAGFPWEWVGIAVVVIVIAVVILYFFAKSHRATIPAGATAPAAPVAPSPGVG